MVPTTDIDRLKLTLQEPNVKSSMFVDTIKSTQRDAYNPSRTLSFRVFVVHFTVLYMAIQNMVHH